VKRFALITALVLLVGLPLGIASLPASLAKYAVARSPAVDAIRYGGSIWNGRATIIIRGGPTGELQWRLSQIRDDESTASFNLQPTFDWSFTNAEIQLTGHIGLGQSAATLRTEGVINSAAIAPVLNPFDIFLSGDFRLSPTVARAPYNTNSFTQVDLPNPLELIWSGGQVSYILANQFNQIALPSLQARLMTEQNLGATATISPISSPAQLLDLTLRNDGWVHIRLRRRFFDLMEQPWPSDQAADEIVMEIERQIL